MPNTAQIGDILFKKGLGIGTTQSGRQFFEEPLKSRLFVIPNQFWIQADQIPSDVTPPHVSQGVIQRVNDYQLTAVVGTTNAYSGALLVDAIPFNWAATGTGYNYNLSDSAGSPISFGVGDWTVDTDAGILMFNSPAAQPSNMPPRISFYRYSGRKGISGTYISGGLNIGGGSGIASGIINNVLQLKSFVGGSGILISGNSQNNTLTLLVTGIAGGGGAGTVTNATNLSPGSGVFYQLNGSTLEFKGISGGYGVGITGDNNTLTFSATGLLSYSETGVFYPRYNPSGFITGGENIGNGISILSGRSNSNLYFYSLSGESGINLRYENNSIIIGTRTNSGTAIVFRSYNLQSGISITGIEFGFTFPSIPKVIGTLKNNSGEPIMLYHISGISNTGFGINFSDTIISNNYSFEYLATTGDGRLGIDCIGSFSGGGGSSQTVDEDQIYLRTRYFV